MQLGLGDMSLQQDTAWEAVPCWGRCWILPGVIPSGTPLRITSESTLDLSSRAHGALGKDKLRWGKPERVSSGGTTTATTLGAWGVRQRLSPSPGPLWPAQHRPPALLASPQAALKAGRESLQRRTSVGGLHALPCPTARRHPRGSGLPSPGKRLQTVQSSARRVARAPPRTLRPDTAGKPAPGRAGIEGKSRAGSGRAQLRDPGAP